MGAHRRDGRVGVALEQRVGEAFELADGLGAPAPSQGWRA
jgi:hypothetical protein